MGMFDNVYVEIQIPKGIPGHDYQTKDFDDPSLDHYTITKEKRLTKSTWNWEKRKRNNPIDINFHGVLYFYTLVPDNKKNDINGKTHWYGYKAKFTDGNCVKVKLVEDR